jgi:hypothetical protein
MKTGLFLKTLLKKLGRSLAKARSLVAAAVRDEAEALVALLEAEADAEMERLDSTLSDSAEKGKVFREWMKGRVDALAREGEGAWKDFKEALPGHAVNLAAEILYAAWRKKRED